MRNVSAQRTRETEQQLPLLAPASSTRRAHAVVYLQDHSIFVNLEPGRTVVLGRSEEADVVIDTSTVSRQHLALRWGDGRLTARDDGSTNGSFVDGQPLIGETTLRGGEEITIGDAVVVVGLITAPRSTIRLLDEATFRARAAELLTRAARLGRPLVLVRLVLGPQAPGDMERLEVALETLPGRALAGPRGEDGWDVVLVDAEMAPARRALEALVEGRGWEASIFSWGLAEYPLHGGDLTALTEHAALQVGVDESEPVLEVQTARPVAADPVTRQLFALVDRVAPSESTVLVVGETGAGKDVVALELHRRSGRAEGPFVHVNCGAIPPTIFAREMFGHEKGAFTGARERSPGLFEAAQGGTLFLDEVAEMPLSEQPRLLRALEHHTFTRVGGVEEISLDLRIVAATNRDLEGLVEQGHFREDLLYRLNVITLFVPALRDRPGDVEVLAKRFFTELSRAFDREGLQLSTEALEVLARYDWPGNVRELRNILERLVLLVTGEEVTAAEALEVLYGAALPSLGGAREVDLKALVEEVEREAIRRMLAACGQNQSVAARRLGISRRALIYKMQRYGIPGRRG